MALLDKVQKLNPPKVLWRECPECQHAISQKEIESMRFDMPCPRCYKTMFSDYVISVVLEPRSK